MASTRVSGLAPRPATNVPMASKRMTTRSNRPALANIGNNRLVVNVDKNAVVKRQTKVAARRIVKAEEQQTQEDLNDEESGCRTTSQPVTDSVVFQNVLLFQEMVLAPVAAAPAVPVLPPGVKDIDQVDATNPQLCSEYVPTMYSYLRQLERETAIKADFLKGTKSKLNLANLFTANFQAVRLMEKCAEFCSTG